MFTPLNKDWEILSIYQVANNHDKFKCSSVMTFFHCNLFENICVFSKKSNYNFYLLFCDARKKTFNSSLMTLKSFYFPLCNSIQKYQITYISFQKIKIMGIII